ncbi:glycerol-3-phosphate dehydrogenase (NAD(P)+) [Frankineae bacterium MT45]|nr:glycerol-3-phosphate dehydrogenase (NAD(P)+) [Frankineae bacterium MT45]
MVNATVLGAGSWGTAYAKVLVDAGCDVTLWARDPRLAEEINATHENARYLAGVALPSQLRACDDYRKALSGAEIVAIAIPSQSLRANLAAWAEWIEPNSTLVSLMKGVELGTSNRMSEVIEQVTGADPSRIAVVSGPNLAGEIAREQPAATVIACTDLDRAVAVQNASANAYFRPYTNVDVIGCELGGAVKNVIALACGMAQGMGFGDNTQGSLMTRGLAETSRLGAALGADPLTFSGLAGMGDLVATCSSPLSRNRTFGERLGRGESLEQAQAATNGQVAEGVKSCRSILSLADRHGVDVPITWAVEAVCYGGLSPAGLMRAMMARTMKNELM